MIQNILCSKPRACSGLPNEGLSRSHSYLPLGCSPAPLLSPSRLLRSTTAVNGIYKCYYRVLQVVRGRSSESTGCRHTAAFSSGGAANAPSNSGVSFRGKNAIVRRPAARVFLLITFRSIAMVLAAVDGCLEAHPATRPRTTASVIFEGFSIQCRRHAYLSSAMPRQQHRGDFHIQRVACC